MRIANRDSHRIRRMTTADRLALRRLSRTVFGQDHRLELMLAIRDAEDQIVTLSELASTLGLPASSLQRPFHALISSGLLTLLPAEPSRFRYYQANRSAAWDWATELEGLATTELSASANPTRRPT